MHCMVVPSVDEQTTEFSPGGVLQLGQGLRMNGSTSELTAGRIVSRADGSVGTIRCSPAGEWGKSSIAFYRNSNGLAPAAGDRWVMGQGIGVLDRGFGIETN